MRFLHTMLRVQDLDAALEAEVGGPVRLMSGVARDGVTEVLRALRAEISEDKLRQKAQDEEPETWQP